MKVLILDTIHGADILAKDYIDSGCEVVCADVYRKTDSETLEKISSMGATVVEEVPIGHYDVIVSPAHCPDRFIEGCSFSERNSFSNAVNQFIDDDRFRIEVTGVKGKTSSCYLIAHILDHAGKKVFLHTSRGQGPYVNGEHKITAKKSIAPTSLLTLPKGDYDVMICEVSLGGSGKADIACITNLVEDYDIASKTRKASDAKASIFSDKINIVPEDELSFWRRYSPDVLRGYGNRIEILNSPKLGESLRIRVRYTESFDIELDPSYVSLQYMPAMELALEICETMGIKPDAVSEALTSFKGVPGRGEIRYDGGKYSITERNPGISHMSIEMMLSCLKRMGALKNAVIILDPVNKKVCDKMDSKAMRDVADSYGVPISIIIGDEIPEIPEDAELVISLIKEGFQ